MDPGGLIWSRFLLVVSVCACVVSGIPIGTSTINCNGGGTKDVGSVDEGYTGDVELVSGITPGQSVKLVPYFFPKHLEFLELSFTLGETTATVRTKKPLDAEPLADADLILHYSVMCDGSVDEGIIKYNNTRRLNVRDLNDHSPVFAQTFYNITVSEIQAVETEVLRVKAEDRDSTSANNRVTYSVVPTSDDFMFTSSGVFTLKRRLNYNLVQKYNFVVTAQDNWGLNDTATVQINVMDFDNLNPYFSHNQYQAFIHENVIGPFENIQPEAIKAQDGDTGINMALTYSIGAVSPEKYHGNFDIISSSGVLTVVAPLDREEMNSNLISLTIKAAQMDDSSKTADVVVSVTVEDVNDNAPKFNQSDYSVTLFENSPVDAVVFKAIVTDLDQGGFVGTLQIIPDSAPFSVSSDGTVRVKNSAALDRETTESFTFQIEATETDPPNSVARAQVIVTLLDENDNSPSFDSSKYKGKVFANQTVGLLLVQVKAEDPDTGVNGEITYSIEFGNNGDYFSIDNNTGAISLAKLIPLEENKVLEFPLYVTARDGGIISRFSSAQVTIQAPGNSKPQFLQKVYHGTVEEELEPGVVITRVNFLALNTEIPVTLTVETEADKFDISSSGELTTKVKLDFDEAPHNYSVQISISDGVNSDSAVVEVQVTDVNDNSPVFASDSVSKSVPEDTDVGTNVTLVPATDKDSSFNKEIRYSLRGGQGRFSIDPVSGMVSVAGALDRETKAEYNLLVVAEDQGRPARSATAALLVQVSDINDNVPKFSKAEYEVEVLETQSVGTSLLTLSAIDPDDGANGTITYSIVQQSPSSDPAVFELGSSSGILQLVQPLDYSEVKVYNLKVQATDRGNPSLVGNSSVLVKVKDLNNNPPAFSKESYNVAVYENLASGASILTLEVTDKDEGGFVGTLHILPESAPFSVSSDGTIRVKNSTALDREANELITFQVEARETEPPNHVAKANVNITLLDENDNSPKFTSNKYNNKVFTNQTEGMFLVKVEADDPDAGVNGEIKYSIDFGNHNDYFSIDENTGAITLAKIIPVEPHKTLDFLLFITARDGGRVGHSASAQVEIVAVGDSKPRFTQSTYRGTIEEERDPGTMILKVNFIATGEIPVTLTVETEADKFDISSSGELTTKVKLDFDEAPHNYSVQISISDGVNSDSAVVEVQVTDVNDNSPVFASDSVSKSVPEDTDVGTNVTLVPATDKDSSFNKEIRYSLRGGQGRFSIDPVSGMVSVAGALDRETKAEYNLLVVAEDQGRPARSATAALLVQVSDINDNVPKFSKAEYEVEVLETQSVGTSLLTLSAIDPDDGANGTITYSIVQQSPSSDPAVFELGSSSGILQLVQPLDYSEVKVYNLKVQATDRGNPSLVGNSSVLVKVKDLNNNPPAFSKESYNVAVYENLASGASILTLEVTDKDEGGFVGTLHILPESAPFSVSSDGTIRVKNSTALDREANELITFQVEARETEPPNHVAKANVNITLLDENDNSPKFTSNKYNNKVFTNQTEGMFLVKVEADDPDAGVNGEIKYSIDFGNHNDYFSIDENTGAITLAKIIPVEPHKTLDFLLFITARDGGRVGHSASAQVEIVAVGDSKPRFTQSTYRGTIEEERDPGTMILKVNFIATGEIPVTLTVETEADKFDISSSGELTTKVKLDFDEAPHNYSVQISISDGVNSDSAVVEVQVTDVNDNSPVFASDSVSKSVPEDTDVGTNVTLVPATDKDSSFNKEIRYSLRGGQGRFSIDPVSGMVSVAGALDRETKAEYNLLVVAEDQGRPARSATAALLVQVSDINDNVPKFSKAEYEVEVLETQSVGTSLLTLSAIDPDDGANGTITYSIVQQSPSSDPAVFELGSSSGILQLVQPLDYTEMKVYNLKVQATDRGNPSLVGNSSVLVKVKDVNNNPPEFSKESYNVAVYENLASGASILTLEVTDEDEGGFSNGYFLYTSDTFDINKQGVVSLRKDVTLDRETKDSYIFQVTAVDQVTEGLNATTQINITVLDYNDNVPQFPTIPDPLPIPEGHYSQETPGEIFTIKPTDADLGVNAEVVVSLASPHPLFRFREDWKLVAVGDLDRESRETYDLVLKASDKGNPQRENFTTVTVRLTDINDNRPEFSSSSYVSSVLQKDAEKGKLLLVLSATDRDAGNNSLITYSFTSGNSPYLDLNGESGAVTLTSNLTDLTEDTTLELTAMAKDHGQPPLNSTARVIVNLRLVSLVEGVAFQSSSYNFSLVENQPTGSTVGKVWASSGSNLYDVAYTLKTHTDLFAVDANGEILTKTSLDKEQQEWYFLDVEAEDTRIPPTSATAVVKVQVEDVNESPQFESEVYRASIFSIAPYKTPVVYVKATDPDVGDEGRLVYSLSESPYFDVDPSSGLVYVVSAASQAGHTSKVEVKATDPRGLNAVTKLEVSVQGSVSSSHVVTISLNQPANVVEKKLPELEKSLGAALAWTVNVIELSSSNGGGADSRSLRSAVRTLVSFVAVDGGEVISSEEVTKKLQSQSAAVSAELSKVFGEEIHFDVQIKPQSPTPDQSAVIALGVLLALSILGLIVTVALIIRFKRKEKNQDSDKEHFNIDQPAADYTNWSGVETTTQGKKRPGDEQKTDSQTDDWRVKPSGDSVRVKGNRNGDTNSCTSSL